MGSSQSTPTTLPLDTYCKDQTIAAKRCMSVNELDAEKYRVNCAKDFEAYAACKKKWQQLYVATLSIAERQREEQEKEKGKTQGE